MPIVNEPWFELPIVTEWTKEGNAIKATQIERFRVDVRDVPSVLGSPPEVITGMNQYDRWYAEEQRRAQEEAEAEARSRTR